MGKALKALIFDCDGTLVDSAHLIIAMMQEAFRVAGVEEPRPSDVRHVVGLSLPLAIAELAPTLSEAGQRELTEQYKRAFQAHRALNGVGHEPLYPNVAQTLAKLDAAGHMMGIATGKSDRGLKATLSGHGIGHHFHSLQTADRHPSKPNPAMLLAALDDLGVPPQEAVMIGDTSYDMEMARAAGVFAVGVDWGYHTRDMLEHAGAGCVAAEFAALPHLLTGT
ncbi:MAG: HAD-IA family hydrolase [Pseudomonadota bacterium]